MALDALLPESARFFLMHCIGARLFEREELLQKKLHRFNDLTHDCQVAPSLLLSLYIQSEFDADGHEHFP